MSNKYVPGDYWLTLGGEVAKITKVHTDAEYTWKTNKIVVKGIVDGKEVSWYSDGTTEEDWKTIYDLKEVLPGYKQETLKIG